MECILRLNFTLHWVHSNKTLVTHKHFSTSKTSGRLVSRVLEYKVVETTDPVNNWIRHIKEKEDKIDKGDKGFSKEIKKDHEVNMEQKFTKIGKSEVRCKAHSLIKY